MLNKRNALETAVDLWGIHQRDEMPRLNRIDEALKVAPPEVGAARISRSALSVKWRVTY